MALDYPTVDRDGTSELLFGTEINDPYRYLEDPKDPRTAVFVTAQNALSEPYLAALPGRAEFLATTTELLMAPRPGVPFEHGGRYFAVANPGDRDQDLLYVADSLPVLLDGGGRVLLDPNSWSTDGAAALTALQVTDDGNLVAYARSDAGSDWLTIRVVVVATGRLLEDELVWSKWVSPTWLPDASAFFYWRYPAQDSADDPEALDAGRLVLHRLGTPQDADETVWEPPDRDWMADPFVSADGRYLVLTAAPGTDSRSTVTVRRLTTGADGRIGVANAEIVVAGELTDSHSVVGMTGDRLYLRTERDSPTGRLVRVDLSDPDPAWLTLVAGAQLGGEPFANTVLVSAHQYADGFVLVWSRDAAHHLEFVDHTGTVTARPDLGGTPLSVTAVHCRAGSAEVFVGTSSFLHREHRYRITAAGRQVDRLPGADPQLPDVRSARVTGRSADGTAVPVTVIGRADRPAGPAPALLYGYGGFDIPILPAFSALFAGWVRAGGVLAVANLRGGGEFGRDWHEAGMLHHKQRVFDDLYGCAEALVADGTTTTDRLAVHGRSNGGLLVGAALTQRPDLWAACLPTVGVLDMLRFHRFTIGYAWTTEYGSPEDAADFPVLLEYSPLHAVRAGTVYPPTLICTGDHDDRVVPAHSLKFGAELQRCQSGEAPVLLRIDTRAGHGMGKPARALAAEYADQLAFAARWTGLR